MLGTIDTTAARRVRGVIVVPVALVLLLSSAAIASQPAPAKATPPAHTAHVAVATPTTTTTTTTTVVPVPPAPPDIQTMVDAALQRLPHGLWDYLVARGWRFETQGARRGYVGFTWRDRKLSVLYARPTMTAEVVLGAVTHEIGHMVDFECFTDADRAAVLVARGRPGTTWFASGDDRHWGVGDWAETFALTITGRWDGLWPSPGLVTAQRLVAEHGCALPGIA